LQRDLTMAISEFAPTSQVMANKRIFESYGLKTVLEKTWPQKRYKYCKEDSFFASWDEGSPEPPTPCGHKLITRTFIIPQFGFVAKRDENTAEINHKPTRNFSQRPFFKDNPLDPVSVKHYGPGGILARLEFIESGTMVILCEGRKGNGFWICNRCGAGFENLPQKHKTPYGKDCFGQCSRVSLGHEFLTNILKISFLGNYRSYAEKFNGLAYSLLYALIEGASQLLDIPTSDLNGTVSGGKGDSKIVIFDNVPGGAGIVDYVSQPANFEKVLHNAYDRVKGICGCSDETSCYGCLRNYRNQFIHQDLVRGPVKQFIAELLAIK